VNAPRLERLKALVEAQPEDPRARYFLANELFRAEDWAGAAEQFGAYVALSGGDDGAAYRSLGLALERLGRREEAAAAYRTGIDSALAHGHDGLAAELRDLLGGGGG
jgi:Flp pilus assembly protein TadD